MKQQLKSIKFQLRWKSQVVPRSLKRLVPHPYPLESTEGGEGARHEEELTNLFLHVSKSLLEESQTARKS